jgi:ketosteroid isomerase-like protein
MGKLTPIVQQIYANFGRGDVAAIAATFAEDIRFMHPGGPDVPYAKHRQGKAQAAAFFGELAAAVEVTLFEPMRFVEQGNSVVALGRWAGRGRRTGRAFEADWAMLWTFDGALVSHYQDFDDTLALAKALAD